MGDPFALATISIAYVSICGNAKTGLTSQLAWLITFVASVIARIRGDFPNFAWWAIAYLLCVVVGVFIVVGSDSTHTYQVAVGL